VKIYAIQDSNNSDIGKVCPTSSDLTENTSLTATVDTVQLVVLATAEIAVTIIAASVPILRALARDKVPSAGPFLALDETEHWTRQHITDSSADQRSPPPIPEPPDAENIELQPAAKKRWHEEKLRVQHLSRIQEFDEAVLERSPRRNGWTPV
jgi:hypothetical protein